MSNVKKLSVFLAADTLDFLNVLADDDSENVGISTAVNLAVQLCAIAARQKIELTTGELLYCCDVLNGGAHLTEFTPPDHANILHSIDSMLWSLRDGVHEPGMLEKWDIDNGVVDKLDAMQLPELFALAFATRMFWSRGDYGDYGDYKKPGHCADYASWAEQFIR